MEISAGGQCCFRTTDYDESSVAGGGCGSDAQRAYEVCGLVGAARETWRTLQIKNSHPTRRMAELPRQLFSVNMRDINFQNNDVPGIDCIVSCSP